MSFILITEIIGSILYLFQKIFLSKKKRLGWILGILGAICFSIVTFKSHSYSYLILEVTSGIVFLSGYILWNKKTDLKKQITITMSTITFISIGVMFILQLGSQNWLLETLMVVLFAVGAIFLALKKAIGWLLYLAGHITLILYALTLETYFILALNIISIYFAMKGYYKLRRIEPSDHQGLQLSIL